MTFSYSKELSSTRTFSHEHGFTIGVEVEIKAGVPSASERSIKVSASTTNTW